jgi:hypothetical protein
MDYEQLNPSTMQPARLPLPNQLAGRVLLFFIRSTTALVLLAIFVVSEAAPLTRICSKLLCAIPKLFRTFSRRAKPTRNLPVNSTGNFPPDSVAVNNKCGKTFHHAWTPPAPRACFSRHESMRMHHRNNLGSQENF